MRLERRAKLRDAINAGHARDRQGRRRLQPQRVLRPGPQPDRLGPGPRGVRPQRRSRDKTRDLYGRNTFGQSCLLARRLVEAGTRVVEVDLAQGRQLRQPLVGPPRRPDQADARTSPARCSTPGLSGLLDRPRPARAARRDAGRRRRRVRPQPAEGRQHLRQRQQRRRPRPLAVLLHRRPRRRRHQARATSTASPTRPARPRSRTRSTPASCWRRSTTPSASTRPRSSTTT